MYHWALKIILPTFRILLFWDVLLVGIFEPANQ
jgi:hypothetical protein